MREKTARSLVENMLNDLGGGCRARGNTIRGEWGSTTMVTQIKLAIGRPTV